MRAETADFLRGVLTSRIGWLAQTISKGPENTHELANELATCGIALEDITTPPAPPMPVAPVTPRANELMTFVGAHATDLAELQALIATGSGKDHPAYKLVRSIRSFVPPAAPAA